MPFIPARLSYRLISIIVISSVILLICLSHGISAKKRIIQITDDMMEKGQLVGVFWRVAYAEKGYVTLTRYGYSIKLESEKLKDCVKGDSVSFIVRKKGINSGETQWIPEKIHLHGKNSLKFFLSLVAIFISVFVCFRNFELQKDSKSLIFKGESP